MTDNSLKKPIRVLLVDDEKNIRTLLSVALMDAGHTVAAASSVAEASDLLKAGAFDLVLTDFRMGDSTGLELLQEARRAALETPVVVMTAFASIENALAVTREGAFDYLPKPFTNTQLLHLVGRIQERIALKQENEALRRELGQRDYFKGFTSVAMQRLEEFVRKTAPTDETILLVGESGTGKSQLAKTIHQRSRRMAGPFATVYCTTIAETVLESELFGHAKGAFTGAIQEKMGKFELAAGGTLFLDEIGDLSPAAQAKLLRFLQDKVIERVGSNREIAVDARIIAATNRDLQQAVADGKFREDLYFRLNVLECELVPLRHRKEDIPVLIQRFLESAAGSARPNAAHTSRAATFGVFPADMMERMLAYAWPGNLRELRNVVERLAILGSGRAVDAADLPPSMRPGGHPAAPKGFVPRTLEELEKEQITATLAIEKNQESAARMLGITTVTLWRKRKQYGLP